MHATFFPYLEAGQFNFIVSCQKDPKYEGDYNFDKVLLGVLVTSVISSGFDFDICLEVLTLSNLTTIQFTCPLCLAWLFVAMTSLFNIMYGGFSSPLWDGISKKWASFIPLDLIVYKT